MKRAVCFTTAALSAAFAFGLWAQDMGGQDQPAQEMPKPGEHHEHLKAFVGTWEWTATFNMGGQVAEGKGTETCESKADGLWLVFEANGDMMGGKFWGHGVIGYDMQLKKYVGSWVDNCADYVQVSEGECSDGGKTFTTVSKVKDMMDPTKWTTMKQVHKVTGKDTKTIEFFMPGADGKETKCGTIEYTRKK